MSAVLHTRNLNSRDIWQPCNVSGFYANLRFGSNRCERFLDYEKFVYLLADLRLVATQLPLLFPNYVICYLSKNYRIVESYWWYEREEKTRLAIVIYLSSLSLCLPKNLIICSIEIELRAVCSNTHKWCAILARMLNCSNSITLAPRN